MHPYEQYLIGRLGRRGYLDNPPAWAREEYAKQRREAEERERENAKALDALCADPAATEAVRTLAASPHGLRTVERAILHLRGHAPIAATPPQTGLEATNAPPAR